ncbi:Phosphatidylinositol N-acetylglucosaminyltransferase GPI2 subunit [Diplonema papillatum]|nr:Phosphatidylinositol N-acetylglucosaminyltransferase GPI2 subunit [Diplonema papillatum]
MSRKSAKQSVKGATREGNGVSTATDGDRGPGRGEAGGDDGCGRGGENRRKPRPRDGTSGADGRGNCGDADNGNNHNNASNNSCSNSGSKGNSSSGNRNSKGSINGKGNNSSCGNSDSTGNSSNNKGNNNGKGNNSSRGNRDSTCNSSKGNSGHKANRRQGGKALAGGQRWQRVLWQQTGLGDSYVDEERFLEGLQLNTRVRLVPYAQLIKHSTAVTQQVAVATLYLQVFSQLLQGRISSDTVCAACAAAAAAALAVYSVCVLPRGTSSAPQPRADIAAGLSELAISAGALYFVSPILRTLTEPWADDTLTTVCVLLFVVNLATSDYSSAGDFAKETVSVNSASVASVLLASRFEEPGAGFATIALAVLLFTASLPFRRFLRVSYPDAWFALTWLLVGSCFASFVAVDACWAGAFAAVVAGITFAIPAWFNYEQRVAKMQINGPWDEARPTNCAAAAEWDTAGLLT